MIKFILVARARRGAPNRIVDRMFVHANSIALGTIREPYERATQHTDRASPSDKVTHLPWNSTYNVASRTVFWPLGASASSLVPVGFSCSRGPKYSFSRGRALDASLSHSVFTTNNYITTPKKPFTAN